MNGDKVILKIRNEFTGYQELGILRELKNQRPGINLRHTSIVGITVIAKSKRGGAQVSVMKNGTYGMSTRIPGNRRDYNVRAPYTFQRMQLDIPRGQTQYDIKLSLEGKIKVKSVILTLRRNQNRGGRGNVKRITLQKHGEEFRGMNTIRLKGELKRQRPNLRLRDFNLKKVIVMAKSFRGRGSMDLVIDGMQVSSSNVPGFPRGYDARDMRSYKRLVLKPRGQDTTGKWQLDLRGKIKIDSLTLVLEPKRVQGRGRGQGRGQGRRH